MKRFFTALALLIWAPAAALAADGTPAQLDLTPYEGKVVLVDFWASWCGPCMKSFPWMEQMTARYGEDGFVVLAVNLDEDSEAAEAFLKERSADFVHLSDPEGALAEQMGVGTMPTSFLFDREGNAAYQHAGFKSKQTAKYEKKIRALLAGEKGQLKIGPVVAKKGLRPWERGVLAAGAMRLLSDPLEAEFDDHIYFSKEASSGGRGFGGGGCGCN